MTVEVISIILALVALIVTIIGFFASLYFYRRGVEAQSGAEQLLTRIEEKSLLIQNQVSELFEKTLDAALSRRDFVSDLETADRQLTELRESLSEKLTGASLLDSSEGQGSGIEPLIKSVDQQVDQIRRSLEAQKETLTEVLRSTATRDPRSRRTVYLVSYAKLEKRQAVLDSLSLAIQGSVLSPVIVNIHDASLQSMHPANYGYTGGWDNNDVIVLITDSENNRDALEFAKAVKANSGSIDTGIILATVGAVDADEWKGIARRIVQFEPTPSRYRNKELVAVVSDSIL